MRKSVFLILSLVIPLGIIFGVLYFLSLSLAPIDQNAATDLAQLKQSRSISDEVDPFKYTQGEVIVVYKDDKINLDSKLSIPRLWTVHNKYDLTTLDRVSDDNVELVISDKSTEVLIEELSANPNVEYAQPNYQYQPLSINTNDTFKDKLWGLDNTGQIINDQPSKVDADIDAPEAWSVGTGKDSNVVVAVVDTGVGYNNPDLKDKMWNGSYCKNENGITINGCIHGYDFEDNDKDPSPDSSSHGTHVAGTIAAASNNGQGIVGVAPNVEIMALKTDFSSMGTYKAIKFASYNGADVINASYGGPGEDALNKQAIEGFGGLFVAAAGNSGINHSTKHFYPCDYDSANIICVAATDHNDDLSVFGVGAGSDYGLSEVDVAAPGSDIYSAVVDSEIFYEDFNNTSENSIPMGWTKSQSSMWGAKYLNPGFGNLLYGDTTSNPYQSNANTNITTPKINVASANGASMSFYAVCDTPYELMMYDFMTVSLTKDGVNYEVMKFPHYPDYEFHWNERVLDTLSGDASSAGNAGYYFSEVKIPRKFLSAGFRIRFEWNTNSTDNDYAGCGIDFLSVNLFSKGSEGLYDFKSGTSMAAPHVAGLAGLMLSERPSMTATQLKTVIMDTGDSLSPLQGKTFTGKRINAHKAMIEVMKISPPTSSPTPTTFVTVKPSVVPTTGSGNKIVCGAADVNNDGKFTIIDLQVFSVMYGTGITLCSDTSNNYGVCGGKDWNKDGKLNIVDFGADSGFAKRYSPKNCNM